MLCLAAVLITVVAIHIPPVLHTNPSTGCNFTTCSPTQSTRIHMNKILGVEKVVETLSDSYERDKVTEWNFVLANQDRKLQGCLAKYERKRHFQFTFFSLRNCGHGMALLEASVAFHGSDIKPNQVLLIPSVTGRPPLCPCLVLSPAHLLQQPGPFCPIELTVFFLL